MCDSEFRDHPAYGWRDERVTGGWRLIEVRCLKLTGGTSDLMSASSRSARPARHSPIATSSVSTRGARSAGFSSNAFLVGREGGPDGFSDQNAPNAAKEH